MDAIFIRAYSVQILNTCYGKVLRLTPTHIVECLYNGTMSKDSSFNDIMHEWGKNLIKLTDKLLILG